MNDAKPSRWWTIVKWLLIIIVPLAVGIFLSLQFVSQPVVGVIYLDDAIADKTAQDMLTQINYARQTDNVRAVVLVLNSPGGTVVDTESVYMELARLRQIKPVITMVEGEAASGAYYLASGTDYIFAKPSSLVGNIGVIGYMPSQPTIYEETISTGPYKLWGYPRDTMLRQTDTLKREFLQVVKLGRGSALKIPDEEIISGQIWLGMDALSKGIIDELGSQSMAFDMAGKIAKISHYEVKDLRPLSGLHDVTITPSAFFYQTPDGTLTPYPNKAGIYFLYVPEMEVKQ